MPEPASEDLSPPQTPDARLAEALRPAVGAAIWRSVRHEPRAWVEALFPILLPAIRVAITAALRDLVATLNQILEQSLSLRSWRWRVEAWRTGKSFGEVVLLRTLVYRVEQVLLVDRNAGLLMASAAAPGIRPKDTDLVSAMLTALQDFISDSFEVDRRTGIRELHVGDFSLLVESGPRAALAAAVRGHAPAALRETLRAAIDLVHQEFAAELREFRGDPQPLGRSRTILEGCLQAQFQERRRPSSARLWLVTAAAALALAAWIGFRVEHVRRWERAAAEVGDSPGITVTHSGREGGRYVLEGLRDPLAAAPESLLARRGIDPREVDLRFRPYLSLDPVLVARRAGAALNAPSTVSLDLQGGVLRLGGKAPHAWILRAREAGPGLALAGILAVDTGSLIDSGLEALRAEIETAGVLFATGSPAIGPEQAQAVKALAVKAREWRDGMVAIGRVPLLEVLGYADATGTEPQNLSLSRLRAESLAQVLLAEGISRQELTVRGEGQRANGSTPEQQRKAILRPRAAEPQGRSAP